MATTKLSTLGVPGRTTTFSPKTEISVEPGIVRLTLRSTIVEEMTLASTIHEAATLNSTIDESLTLKSTIKAES